MSETLQIRIHGDEAAPTLIYLPGLHGDWTLVGNFRRAVAGRVRFVEMIYPRTLTWSLEEYAVAIETALLERGIARGWLLGESFGSQIAWPLSARKQFLTDGIILAGGFGRHPLQGAVLLAERIAGRIPLSLLTQILFGYARLARGRFRRSPEAQAEIQEFIARRTELDRRAAVHRLHLVARSDFRPILCAFPVPVFALTGAFDPIVPWMLVRRSLRRGCPALREFKIFWRADHTVLGSAPKPSADLVIKWMR